MSEKIKVTLDGTAETMLQSFYARAKYSLKKGHKFYDAKAVELVNKIDYDFSSAEEDSTMSNGVIARTLVFDELVEDFIDRNSECTVVNIACGLDTRFYRMDNGKLRWYNLDLPETIAVRDQIYQESGRVSTIGISALDPAWADRIDAQGKMLFIIEGLSMYLTPEENATMLEIIRDHFDNATVSVWPRNGSIKRTLKNPFKRRAQNLFLERIVLKIWEMLQRDFVRSKMIILHEA